MKVLSFDVGIANLAYCVLEKMENDFNIINHYIDKSVKEVIKDFDNVKIVMTFNDRVYDWERVTQIYNYVKSKENNIFIRCV